jgi:ADP-ribosylglycohydrolase
MVSRIKWLKTFNFKKQDPLLSKVQGALIGFAVADAIGVPHEFKPRNETQHVSSMTGFGTHQQPPGSWSDDSSMTFSLVECLIEGYDRERLKRKYCDWYYWGKWTHDQNLPFDIGRITFKALSRIKAGISSGETGLTDEKSNGNGSVMRVLPLAFTLSDKSQKEKIRVIEEVSGITHAHIRSKIACVMYVEMVEQIIKGLEPQDSYNEMVRNIKLYYEGEKSELLHYDRILNCKLLDLSVDEIRSTGYVVDTIEATLWCFVNSSSYESAVLKAVRLGDDTDTIGAMVGGLAGIYYGIDSIPMKWRKNLARREDIKELSERFYQKLIEI